MFGGLKQLEQIKIIRGCIFFFSFCVVYFIPTYSDNFAFLIFLTQGRLFLPKAYRFKQKAIYNFQVSYHA